MDHAHKVVFASPASIVPFRLDGRHTFMLDYTTRPFSGTALSRSSVDLDGINFRYIGSAREDAEDAS